MSLSGHIQELRKYRFPILLLFIFCMMSTLSFLAARSMRSTLAAPVTGFNPGNIISDAMMANYNSMNKDEIQRFLSSKNKCNNTNYQQYLSLKAQYPNTDWHFENGHFVCLAEERFGDGVTIGSGQTAAEIIYQAAQDYQINPQVLLVLLEKEQSLITDTYPNSKQYRSATGYGCPDTAPCNAEYYGFKNQVRKAAAMFRTVLDGGWSNYPAGRTSYVQYNPNSACGGTQVYIENRATSALYRYTPYQPNASALNAGYGAGDSCGAYGNRNFYLYFTDWFGSTQLEIPIARYPVIEDGVYTLTSAVTYNTAVTATSNKSGGNVSLNARKGLDTQKWQITYHESDATYSFINKATGLALDIHAASVASGANVEATTKNEHCNQKWHAITHDDGTFSFVSACSLTVALDVYGASAADGANLQSFSYHGGAGQKWHVIPDAALPNGLYSISPMHNETLTLDVYGGYINPQTNVQVYTNHESRGEKWQLQYNSQDGTYKITSLGSGLSLDVYGGYTKNGTNIQMYKYHGGCGQKWLIVPSGKGYTITSACSGLSLDVYGGSKASGTNVQLWQQNNANNQLWKITPTTQGVLESGVYQLFAAGNTKLALDAGKANASGDNVRIFNQQNSKAQKWRLDYNANDDTYFITNAQSGLSLDVYGGYTWDETNVQLFTAHRGPNQKWKIEKNTDGTYTVYSARSNKPLDVYGGGTTSGSNVQQFSWHGGSNQRWRIVKG